MYFNLTNILLMSSLVSFQEFSITILKKKKKRKFVIFSYQDKFIGLEAYVYLKFLLFEIELYASTIINERKGQLPHTSPNTE